MSIDLFAVQQLRQRYAASGQRLHEHYALLALARIHRSKGAYRSADRLEIIAESITLAAEIQMSIAWRRLPYRLRRRYIQEEWIKDKIKARMFPIAIEVNAELDKL